MAHRDTSSGSGTQGPNDAPTQRPRGRGGMAPGARAEAGRALCLSAETDTEHGEVTHPRPSVGSGGGAGLQVFASVSCRRGRPGLVLKPWALP